MKSILSLFVSISLAWVSVAQAEDANSVKSAGVDLLERSMSVMETSLSAEEMWSLIGREGNVSFQVDGSDINIKRSEKDRSLLLSVKNAAGDLIDARRIVTPQDASAREIAEYLQTTLNSVSFATTSIKGFRSIASDDNGIISPRSERRINALVGILSVISAFTAYDAVESGNYKKAGAILAVTGIILGTDYFIIN